MLNITKGETFRAATARTRFSKSTRWPIFRAFKDLPEKELESETEPLSSSEEEMETVVSKMKTLANENSSNTLESLEKEEQLGLIEPGSASLLYFKKISLYFPTKLPFLK